MRSCAFLPTELISRLHSHDISLFFLVSACRFLTGDAPTGSGQIERNRFQATCAEAGIKLAVGVQTRDGEVGIRRIRI